MGFFPWVRVDRWLGEGELLQYVKRTLPVAPQHASRASSITMLKSLARASSARNRAADAPVMPEPTTTTSAVGGRFGVVRCPRRNSDGSLCQNEAVDFSEGRPAMLSIGEALL